MPKLIRRSSFTRAVLSEWLSKRINLLLSISYQYFAPDGSLVQVAKLSKALMLASLCREIDVKTSTIAQSMN